MHSLFQSFMRLSAALIIASSLAMAANNPDITIGATTDGPKYIAIGTGATITATLHWPSDATPVSGTFTWTASPNNLGSFSPASTTGSSTSSTSFFGYRAGTTTIKVRWVPSQSGYDTAESTKSVTIVEIASLSVTGALQVGATTTYATGRGDGDVLVEAILNPSVSASDLPSGFVLWAGGVAGDTILQRKVTKSVADSTNVVAMVGSSSKDVTIKVYEIISLGVTGAEKQGSTNTYVTQKGTGDVVLTAELYPSASASEIPSGLVTWTPATLQGDDQLSRKVPKSTEATTEVTVTCGSSQKSAKIIVADINSDTVLTAPDGTADTRLTIGVCEKVDFSLTQSLVAHQWTASAGTPTSGSGATWRWQAPETATSVTVTATLEGGTTFTKTMTVISPTGITGTKTHDWTTAGGEIAAGVAGAGMELDMRVEPPSVNFGYLEASEVPSGGEGVQGYFSQFSPAQLAHTTAGHWFAISADNLWFDTAAIVGLPQPWADGQYHWTIPNHYRCAGTSGAGHLYATTTQLFSLRATGEATVSKVGQSSTRTP